MPTAISSATSASRKNQIISLRLPRSPRLAAAACLVLLVAGCATAPPPAPLPAPPVAPAPAPPPSAAPSPPVVPAPSFATYAPVAWSALPGWNADRVQDAWPAFRAGCRKLVDEARTRELWQPSCTAAEAVDAREQPAVRAFYERHFSPYEVRADDGRDRGLVTGYYEPLLAGSRTKTASFRVPLYETPDDLLTVDLTDLHPDLKDRRLRGRVEGRRVVPYWSRADIEAGRARIADKVLVWVADPVEAFFLQIQGSGRVALADGGVMRVGYDDQNGHPYRSIGRILVDRGELPLERASMQGIMEWGRRNPEKLTALLDENPSYVFFREVPPPAPGTLEAAIDGPIGSLGVPLLRERTIAVDQRSVPLGTPVFLATTHPLTTRPLERLMMAQDTGGAIRGAVRADFFWGFGDAAGREAGRMRQQGRMWILWPKGAPPPVR
jgi:membrane-bound lytic murein transglycosylase A